MSQIALRNVSLSRNNTVILQNINLIIPGGEWTSIVGPNGAGKSTLVQALAGLLLYEGSIQIGGAELRSIAIKARAQQIAWLEQATSIPDGLDFGLRVYDIAMLGRLPHQSFPFQAPKITLWLNKRCVKRLYGTCASAFLVSSRGVSVSAFYWPGSLLLKPPYS
jgi:ABC-type cobalamin/Fe3+-siderophores transport system ATPase subunit